MTVRPTGGAAPHPRTLTSPPSGADGAAFACPVEAGQTIESGALDEARALHGDDAHGGTAAERYAAALERRVLDLERRLAAVEASTSATASPPASPPAPLPVPVPPVPVPRAATPRGPSGDASIGPPGLLDYTAAAKRLGIGVRTLRKVVDGGGLRPVRIRGRVLFAADALDAYARACASGIVRGPKGRPGARVRSTEERTRRVKTPKTTRTKTGEGAP